MKILVSILCALSLTLSAITFKREFIDVPNDLIVYSKLGYIIGCIDGGYSMPQTINQTDPSFLAAYCGQLGYKRKNKDLIDFIEKLNYNTKYGERILNGGK